jgi:hypothetical protein
MGQAHRNMNDFQGGAELVSHIPGDHKSLVGIFGKIGAKTYSPEQL